MSLRTLSVPKLRMVRMAGNFSCGVVGSNPSGSLDLAFSHSHDVMTISYVSLFIYIFIKLIYFLFIKDERYLVTLSQSKYVHLCKPNFA